MNKKFDTIVQHVIRLKIAARFTKRDSTSPSNAFPPKKQSHANAINQPRNGDEGGGPTSPPILTVEEIANCQGDVRADVKNVHEGGEEERSVEK